MSSEGVRVEGGEGRGRELVEVILRGGVSLRLSCVSSLLKERRKT